MMRCIATKRRHTRITAILPSGMMMSGILAINRTR